jgi:hypothetical protein
MFSLAVGRVDCKLLNVSSARVKQLGKAGELAEVGTDSDGVARLERKFDSAHESENAIVDSASAR